MKRIEILNINANIDRLFANQKYPFKLMYALTKSGNKLKKEVKDTWAAIDGMKSEALKKLLEESTPIHQEQMAEILKTEPFNDGTDSEKNAFLTLKPSKKLIIEFDEFVNERDHILNEEVKFDFHKVEMSVVENLEFNTAQMKVIDLMLEEE